MDGKTLHNGEQSYRSAPTLGVRSRWARVSKCMLLVSYPRRSEVAVSLACSCSESEMNVDERLGMQYMPNIRVC